MAWNTNFGMHDYFNNLNVGDYFSCSKATVAEKISKGMAIVVVADPYERPVCGEKIRVHHNCIVRKISKDSIQEKSQPQG